MTQACFWTALAKVEQDCGQPVVVAAYTFNTSSARTLLLAEDVGVTVPALAAPQVVNLLDLPGASYSLASTNACGGAIALDLTAGVLSTPAAQSAGGCVEAYDGTLALTITAATFPLQAGDEALYGGRLLGNSYGYGVEGGSGSDGIVVLGLAAVTPDSMAPLGNVRYFSMTPGPVDDNAGGADAAGIAAAITGGGLYVHVLTAPGGTFNFSTNLEMHVPPAQPQRFYAIVEEHWPVESDPGGMAFPATPGTADGVTTIPINCVARNLTWDDMTPAIDATNVALAHGAGGAASLDMSRIYKLGVYAGDEGYTNMARTATLKLTPSGGGGF